MPKSSWSVFPALFIIAGFFLLGAMGLFIYSVVEVHRAEGLAGKIWPVSDNHKVLWKTYISSAYSFKYPVGMKYLHPEGSAVVGSLDDPKAREWYQNMIVGSKENLPILTVYVMKDKTEFQTALEQANIKYYSKTSEFITGTKFDKYTATGTPYNQSEYVYATDDGNNYFLITLTSYSTELTALAQKILLSFEISVPMANWQTYENKDYGFSFKYPNGFTVERDPSSSLANDAIVVGKGKIEYQAIGDNTGFFQISKINEDNKDVYDLIKKENNPKISDLIVGGELCKRLDYIDTNSFEGNPGGKTIYIRCPSYQIWVVERAANKDWDFDVIGTANKIISSLKKI